jgi:hypothetical protein
MARRWSPVRAYLGTKYWRAFYSSERIAGLLKDIVLLDDDGIRAVSILASGLGEGRRQNENTG